MPLFSRRDFLKFLGASSLSPLLLAQPRQEQPQAQPRKVYLQFVPMPVAGFQYYDGTREEVFAGLKVGDELTLHREPLNEHDEKAIEIYTADGHKLGYVPRSVNEQPAMLADQDVPLGAEILSLAADREEWSPVFARLYMLVGG